MATYYITIAQEVTEYYSYAIEAATASDAKAKADAIYEMNPGSPDERDYGEIHIMSECHEPDCCNPDKA